MKTVIISLFFALILSTSALADKNSTIIEVGPKGTNIYDVRTDAQGNTTVYDFDRDKFWFQSNSDSKSHDRQRDQIPGVNVYGSDDDNTNHYTVIG